MIFLLAQSQAQAATDAVALDWKHAVLAALIPIAAWAWGWFRSRGYKLLEAKLASGGHPQSAQALDLLVAAFNDAATDQEKAKLATAAKLAGLDHPAIKEATS